MSTRLDFTTADFLECSICVRDFDTQTRIPKVLHCGHTICQECSLHLKTNAVEAERVPKFRCPICRSYMPNKISTNFQFMAFLTEKEKHEKEMESGEKKPEDDEGLFLRFGRSKQLNVHVAKKKELSTPEMYVRKETNGTTSIVFASATGSPSEIVDYINHNEIGVETGAIRTRVVKERCRTTSTEFAKVTTVPLGVSPLRCTEPPKKLEELEFVDSFELRAGQNEDGTVRLEMVRSTKTPIGTEERSVFDPITQVETNAPNEDLEEFWRDNYYELRALQEDEEIERVDLDYVFGGTMAKKIVRTQKREEAPAPPDNEEGTSGEGPVSKRTRRGATN